MYSLPAANQFIRFLHRLIWVVGSFQLAIVIVGCLVWTVVPFDNWKSYFDAASGDGSSDAFHQRVYDDLRVVAIGILATASSLTAIVGIWWRQVSNQTLAWLTKLTTEISSISLWFRNNPSVICSLLGSMIVAALIPLPYIDEEIRYDEAHTYVNYARPPLYVALTRYDAPNNHAMHSIVANVSLRIVGDTLWGLRFPAFVAGILAVGVLTLWGSVIFRPSIGFASGLLLASSPVAVEQLTNARGYTMTAFFFGLSIVAVWTINRTNFYCAWIVWVVSSTLSIYTVPTMVYAVWITSVWLLGITWIVPRDLSGTGQSKQRKLIAQIVAMLVIALLSLALYLPILVTNDWEQLRSNLHVTRLSTTEFWKRLPQSVVSTYHWMIWGTPVFVVGYVLTGFFSSFFFGHERTRAEVRVFFASVVSLAIPLCLQSLLPPERVWFFLYPVFLGFASLGCFSIFQLWVPKLAEAITILVSSCLAIGLAISLHTSQLLHTSERNATFRESAQVAEFLNEEVKPREPIILVSPASAPIIYVFFREGWSSEHFLVPGRGETSDDSALLVTSLAFHQTPDDVLKALPALSVFAGYRISRIKCFATAEVYRLERP